jgi:hypothetical protein
MNALVSLAGIPAARNIGQAEVLERRFQSVDNELSSRLLNSDLSGLELRCRLSRCLAPLHLQHVVQG